MFFPHYLSRNASHSRLKWPSFLSQASCGSTHNDFLTFCLCTVTLQILKVSSTNPLYFIPFIGASSPLQRSCISSPRHPSGSAFNLKIGKSKYMTEQFSFLLFSRSKRKIMPHGSVLLSNDILFLLSSNKIKKFSCFFSALLTFCSFNQYLERKNKSTTFCGIVFVRQLKGQSVQEDRDLIFRLGVRFVMCVYRGA